MIQESLQAIVDAIKAAGVPASSDPRNLSLPGVLVTLDTFEFNRLDAATAQVAVRLLAIASDTGNPYPQLDRLADALHGIATEWEAVNAILPNQSAGTLPALQTTITVETTKE